MCKLSVNVTVKLNHARLECGKFWVQASVSTKNIKLEFVASPLLRSKSKERLTRNQDNVSEWVKYKFFFT